MSEGERRRRTGGTLIIAVVLMVIGFGAGSCIFYNIGMERGEEQAREELEGEVQKIGELVLEKGEVARAGREALDFTGESLSNTELERLVNSLKGIEEKAEVGAAREVVVNLLRRTEEFRELYAEGDAVVIAQEYEGLKDAFREGEEKLNDIYNSEITSSFMSDFERS